MTNCMIVFFTSDTFREVYTAGSVNSITYWDLTKFLVAIVILEHILMICQMCLSVLVDDKPEFVKVGERERNIL